MQSNGTRQRNVILPHPISADKTPEYEKSGANIILRFGRLLCEFENALAYKGFKGHRKPQEIKHEIWAMQKRLEIFFEAENKRAILKRFIARPKEKTRIDLRVASVIAYLSAKLIHGNAEACPLSALIHTCSAADPDDSSPLVYRHIVSAVLVHGVAGTLEVTEEGYGSSGANPGVRLGKEYLKRFFGIRSLPELTRETVQEARQAKRQATASKNPALMAMKKRVESRRQKEATDKAGTPQQLYNQLKEFVVGQDEACRVIATRIAGFHLKRSGLLKDGKDPETPPELLLVLGSSGTGKTFACENAARLSGLNFGAYSAPALTAAGYVGLDVETCIQDLCRCSNPNDSTTMARLYNSIFYLDEFDALAARSGQIRDIGGSDVQTALLRVIEGTRVLLSGRRREMTKGISTIDTSAFMFILSGSFSGKGSIGLKAILGERKAKGGIGFGATPKTRREMAVYDALQEMGILPEILNRLTSLIVMRRLEQSDLERICIGQHGIINGYNCVLSSQSIRISMNQKAVRTVAKYCAETDLLARGLKLIISKAVEPILFDGRPGEYELEPAHIDKAIQSYAAVEGGNF